MLLPIALLVGFADLVTLTTAEDHKRTLALLGIGELRRGADGRNKDAPNTANYDESKANPFPALPGRYFWTSQNAISSVKQRASAE